MTKRIYPSIHCFEQFSFGHCFGFRASNFDFFDTEKSFPFRRYIMGLKEAMCIAGKRGSQIIWEMRDCIRSMSSRVSTSKKIFGSGISTSRILSGFDFRISLAPMSPVVDITAE